MAGCPDDPPPGDCAGEGDGELIVSRRDDDAPVLVDGDELDVFPPPQGGTFTELDVAIAGLRDDEIDTLRIDIARRDDGSPLAAQRYQGAALPYLCQPDDTLIVQNMPVAFFESVVLNELEGVEVSMSVVAEIGDDEVRFDVDLVLVVTSF